MFMSSKVVDTQSINACLSEEMTIIIKQCPGRDFVFKSKMLHEKFLSFFWGSVSAVAIGRPLWSVFGCALRGCIEWSAQGHPLHQRHQTPDV